jgi:hypothetical protein
MAHNTVESDTHAGAQLGGGHHEINVPQARLRLTRTIGGSIPETGNWLPATLPYHALWFDLDGLWEDRRDSHKGPRQAAPTVTDILG